MSKPPTQEKPGPWTPLKGVTPVPLGSPGCKWPLNVKDEDGIDMACGAKKVIGEPYCAAHLAIGTNPRITRARAKPKAEAF